MDKNFIILKDFKQIIDLFATFATSMVLFISSFILRDKAVVLHQYEGIIIHIDHLVQERYNIVKIYVIFFF